MLIMTMTIEKAANIKCITKCNKIIYKISKPRIVLVLEQEEYKKSQEHKRCISTVVIVWCGHKVFCLILTPMLSCCKPVWLWVKQNSVQYCMMICAVTGLRYGKMCFFIYFEPVLRCVIVNGLYSSCNRHVCVMWMSARCSVTPFSLFLQPASPLTRKTII